MALPSRDQLGTAQSNGREMTACRFRPSESTRKIPGTAAGLVTIERDQLAVGRPSGSSGIVIEMGKLNLVATSSVADEDFLAASAHRHPDNARAVGGRLRIELGKLRAELILLFPRSEPPGSESCAAALQMEGGSAMSPLRIDKARAVACEGIRSMDRWVSRLVGPPLAEIGSQRGELTLIVEIYKGVSIWSPHKSAATHFAEGIAPLSPGRCDIAGHCAPVHRHLVDIAAERDRGSQEGDV